MQKLSIFCASLLVAFLMYACNMQPNSPESPTEEEIEATLTEGTNMAAAISPNKQTIAIDLQGTIWLLSLEGGTAKAITDEMGDAHEPAWSPDGKKLAFHSYKSGNYQIWSINKDGSELTQLTFGEFDCREPYWSADGESIVFSTDRNGNYDIYKVDVESKEIVQITDAPENEYHPAYAHKENFIAYVSENAKAPGIYKINEDGTEAALLYATKNTLTTPSWSHNNEYLTLNEYNGENSSLVYFSLADRTGEAIVNNEDIFPFRASWLGDNELLYTSDGKMKRKVIGESGFSEVPFEATVTLKRPSYTRKTYNFEDQSARPVKGIMGPVISPDGKSVAFTALGDIYIKQLDVKSIKNLTNDVFVDIDPTWSPSGKKIAYLSDKSGNMDLWVRDLATSSDTKLVDLEKDLGFPVWSPDGKTIAFFARDTRNVWGYGVLHLVDVSSGKVTSLENTQFVPSKPTWSPDSQLLAVMVLQPYSSRFREGLSKIMLINTEGEVKGYISPEEGRTPAMRNVNGPVWSPNGAHIAYIQDGTLWQLPVDPKGNIDGAPVSLTKELATAPSYTADGQTILYLATDTLKKLDLATGSVEAIDLDFTWQPQVSENIYAVHVGKLFDGLQNKYLENVDIVVEGSRIKEIVPHEENREIPVVDASDKTVIPGLFEMHTHQHATVGERLGRIWLSYGITNIREPGADPYDALERKEAWAAGKRPGPREFFTGGLTDGSRIYYGLANSIVYSSHLDLEMERAKRLGYDLIKTYVRMPDSLQKIITKAAHEMGIPVSSHEIYPAMRYNVDQVEHIRGTSRRGYSMKQSNLKATYGDVIQLLAQSGMHITPTIGLQGGFHILANKQPEIYANKQLNALYSKQYIDYLKGSMGRIQRVFPSYISNFEAIQKGVYEIVKAGGKVGSGTDSPFIPYGTSLHVEMQLFVDGGLTPFEALQTATINAADAMGLADQLGSVEAGKLADFVVVDGDPLGNIQDAWNVVSTFKGGVQYDIDELLAQPSL